MYDRSLVVDTKVFSSVVSVLLSARCDNFTLVVCALTCLTHSFLFTVVNKLSQGGEEDLEEMRKKVQTLADDTAVALKKNVYKNYSQFIETAKEISSACSVFPLRFRSARERNTSEVLVGSAQQQ